MHRCGNCFHRGCIEELFKREMKEHEDYNGYMFPKCPNCRQLFKNIFQLNSNLSIKSIMPL